MTSSDLVIKVRGVLKNALKLKKIKVGHLGTLDPLGCGVLPIAVGKGTKLFDYMLNKRKVYKTAFLFNIETDTLDRGGTITKRDSVYIDEDIINNALHKFKGVIEQIPPQYSAKSVNGSRAYDLARAGITVELAARRIEIFDIRLLKKISDVEYEFIIECSAGTYIRSIARDLAAELNTVAYMSYIERIASGNFLINDSVSFDDFKLNPLEHIMSIDKVLDDMPRYDIKDEDKKKILNGVAIQPIDLPQDIKYDLGVYIDNQLFGIGCNNNGFLDIKVRVYDDKI